MGYLLLIAVIIFVVWLFVKSNSDDKHEAQIHQKYLDSKADFEQTYKECKAITGDIADDDYEDWCEEHCADNIGYSIAGINFRHLDYSHTGPFSGTVKVEPDNPHDSKAVAIFRGRKKVGYIPREFNEGVFYELQKKGGQDTCIGYIHTFLDDELEEKFAGKIVIGPSESITDEGDTGQNTGS